MTLTDPMGPPRLAEDLAVQPLFGLEGRTIPRHELPEGDDAVRRGLLDHPRRAVLDRQRAG